MEKYYIMVNGEQQGPFTNQEIINKGFSNDSYIYNKTLGDWKKISEVADFLSSETEKDIRKENIPAPPPIEISKNNSRYDLLIEERSKHKSDITEFKNKSKSKNLGRRCIWAISINTHLGQSCCS